MSILSFASIVYMDNQLYSSVKSLTLEICPDCLAFVGELIVCGCYQLEEDKKVRGALLLLSETLQEVDRVECDGILDLKVQEQTIYTCTITGKVEGYAVEEGKLRKVRSMDLNGEKA